MASISKERLREMEEEMDRFEAEIQAPPGQGSAGFILGANTFTQVQEQLTSLRKEVDLRQKHQHHHHHPQHPSRDEENEYGDEDLRGGSAPSRVSSRHKQRHDDEDNDFFDVDERPGRSHGPRVAPPPPPPPPPPGVPPSSQAESHMSKILAPPPPPPPPDNMNGAPMHPTPAFMPPQLRHRMPIRPPPGYRPPFPRPPGMRMGGPPPPPPPPPHGGPYGPPRPGPPFMGGGGPPHPMAPGPPGPHMGGPMGPMPPMGPPMAGPMAPQIGPQMMPDMGGLQHTGEGDSGSVISGQPKVYSAAPVINLELKKADTKKKKKKKKDKTDVDSITTSTSSTSSTTTTTSSVAANTTSATTSLDDNTMVSDMDVTPGNTMYGGIIGVNMGVNMGHGGHGVNMNMQQGQQMAGMMQQGQQMMAGMDPNFAGTGMQGMMGMPGGPGGKKEKKKKDKKFIRMAASTTWEDPTLADWANDDFRIFAGDLGNEVTDDTLARAFSKYPGFLKAKVIRDRRSNKTKGYGFVSFKDPVDFARAMREMNGKYVGNRPIKLRKSNWKDRNIEIVKKKDREKKRLGLK